MELGPLSYPAGEGSSNQGVSKKERVQVPATTHTKTIWEVPILQYNRLEPTQVGHLQVDKRSHRSEFLASLPGELRLGLQAARLLWLLPLVW